jgi:hypothetical protein
MRAFVVELFARPNAQRPPSPRPLFAEEAAPPRSPFTLIGIIRMLAETVLGLPDKGRHLQFQKETRRIEWRPLP